MHIDGLKVLTESWVLPERAEAAELEEGSVGAAQEQKVGTRGTPEGNFGKVRRETRDNHAQVGRCKRICLHPLNEFSAWRELLTDGSVILIREKCGDACDPRVRRLGNNQVVLLARSEQEVSRVIENDVNARITQDITVEAFEIRRRADHGGLDLNAINSLDVRVTGDGRGRHTATETDDENSSRGRFKRGSQVTQEELCSSITSGCVYFTVDAEGHVVIRAENGYRVVYAVCRKHEIVCRSNFAKSKMTLIRIPIEYC